MTSILRHLPLGGLDIGTVELADRIGVPERRIYRWSDMLGWDQHVGGGHRLLWTPEQQWTLALVAELVASMSPAMSIMVGRAAAKYPHRHGWVFVSMQTYRTMWVEHPSWLPDVGRDWYDSLSVVLCLDAIAERYEMRPSDRVVDVDPGAYL